MNERSVIHSTFVIRRSYPTTPQRVFAAFADPAKKRRWFAPDQGEQMEEFEMEFRVGGRERKQFTFNAGKVCENRTIYQDIVTDRRIVFAYTMTIGDHCFSASQSTVELLPTDKGTDLIFTEQAAFFENADGPEIREKGWTLLIDRMGNELAG